MRRLERSRKSLDIPILIEMTVATRLIAFVGPARQLSTQVPCYKPLFVGVVLLGLGSASRHHPDIVANNPRHKGLSHLSAERIAGHRLIGGTIRLVRPPVRLRDSPVEEGTFELSVLLSRLGTSLDSIAERM